MKSVNGTGPYTVTMVLNLTQNHLISEPVLDFVTTDGTHTGEYGYLTYFTPAIDAGKSVLR